MKIINDIKLHFVTVLLFGVLFPLLILGIGLFFPNQANGLPIYKDGKLIGFENIGQKFTSDKYFWGRPSAVDYNAAAAGGSNKGPSNKEYLDQVEQRIKDFLAKNPTIKRSQIPSEMVTSSGGGLDPHISLQGALIQVPRIAVARGIDKAKIKQLIINYAEKPLLGLFGTEHLNVLKLNIGLDELK